MTRSVLLGGLTGVIAVALASGLHTGFAASMGLAVGVGLIIRVATGAWQRAHWG